MSERQGAAESMATARSEDLFEKGVGNAYDEAALRARRPDALLVAREAAHKLLVRNGFASGPIPRR